MRAGGAARGAHDSPVLGRTSFASAALLLALRPTPALAHDGPPYPIFVDEPVGDHQLSIWTDPDVGEGTFFYYVEGPADGPTDLVVEVRSKCTATGEATGGCSEPAEERDPFDLIGTVPFGHRGTWHTEFSVHAAEEPGVVLRSLTYELDVTPPGLGPVELTWYAIPFLAAAALWFRVLTAKRAMARSSSEPPPPPPR